MEIVSEGVTLNYVDDKLPMHQTNLPVKQLKTTTPRLHATYPMT